MLPSVPVMKSTCAAAIVVIISVYFPELGLLLPHQLAAESLSTGPTVALSYSHSDTKKNSIDNFMYFIPLTSPARVRLEKSPDNAQQVWITSYTFRNRRNGFYVRCEFVMNGRGYFLNKFNNDDIIAYNTRNLKRPSTILNLDFMRFEGNGFGAIEIEGVTEGEEKIVEKITVSFNERRTKSPVMVGLYAIDPEDGAYAYANRYNPIQARISSLVFKQPKIGEPPKMGLKLSNIGGANSPDGFLSTVKAAFVNLFVKPIEVNPIGNAALLDFGKALFRKAAEYTFPQAANLETE